jgi:lysophospholipase L1-like esterase
MIDNTLDAAFATGNGSLPDLITIHLGTNDCDAAVSASEMVDRMFSLLEHVHGNASNAWVFLADVIATGYNPDMAACIVDFNKQVPSIVSAWQAKGMQIFYVRANDAMQPACGDGNASSPGLDYNLCGGHQIHPTNAGYPRMASAFALSILENFPRSLRHA